MMICEQCETELPGATVICKTCGHNNALKKMDNWREKRDRYLESINVPIAVAAAASSRSNLRDAGNLIRFPKSPMNAKAINQKPETIEATPEWKEKLEARLRQIREQKAAEVEPPATSAPRLESNRQPIVDAALRRINRANYLALVQESEVTTVGAVALATELPAHKTLTNPTIAEAIRVPVQPRVPMVVEPNHFPATDFYEDDILETDSFNFEQESDELDLLHDEQFTPAHCESKVLEAASLKARIAAAVIDAEVIAFSFLPIIAVYAFLGGNFSSVSLTALLTLSTILIAVYFFVTYALAGRTIGMAILKLHLASLKPLTKSVSPDSTSTVSFTFQQAAARAAGGTLSLLLFPVNLFCITRNFDRLSISDYLSGTQVVKIRN
jgi:uncharacterized RDD family membrane protein YckC